MDLVGHALAGGAVGLYYGHPVLGALVAVLPDLPLFRARLATPPTSYDILHSLWPLPLLMLLPQWILWAWVSHLLLDLPSHGKIWAPPLLWPKQTRFSVFGIEWELFNRAWIIGVVVTVSWSSTWILAYLFR